MCNDVESTVALNALGWEPVKAERKKTKAILMFKLLNGMGPTPRKNVCACVNFTEIGLINRVFRACLFHNMAVKRST